MSHELTIDFNDASFDESSANNQPGGPGGVNVDVSFPISDDSTFLSQNPSEDFRTSSTATNPTPASSIALMPDASSRGVMEEFLFEFDNDLGDHDSKAETPNPQGLRITTEGVNDTTGKAIEVMGTFNNLTDGGTLDVYVDTGARVDNDSNPNTPKVPVFEKFSLGAPTANEGNDMAILVSGDMDGADMGAGSDMAMINVDATADMSGLFQGGNGPGMDVLTLVEGIVQDNGAKVDFGLGEYGPNSAVVSNYDGVGSGLNFDIAGWEVLELTGNADYVTIASGTGKGLTDAYDAAYWNGGADNSMLKIMSGYTDNEKADVIEINANSNIYLSFDFVDTDQGIDAVFLSNGNVNVDDYGGSGPEIDVDVIYAGGTGLTVDYLEGTKNADYVTNSGTNGITVDLGGSTSGADVFVGSVASKNDVMDARSVSDLTFAEDGDYIRVTSGTDVNALLKDVDYIMVRDRDQGPETTQADVAAYDAETSRLTKLVNEAQQDLNAFDTEVQRLEGLEADAAKAVTDFKSGVTNGGVTRADLETALNTANSNRVTDPGDTIVTLSEIQAYNSLQTQYSNATDPSTLVVAPTPGVTFPSSGAVGTAGVTDANDDGVVDLSDVQAFIDKRLDADGKQYFADNGIAEADLAQGLLDATPSEIAAHKTAMVAAGLTDASGFDDFINDLPQLVSSEDISNYNTLKTQATTAVDPGDQVVTSAMIQNYNNLEKAYSDAQADLNAFDTEVQRLEGLETAAEDAVSDYKSGVTNSGVTRASLETAKSVADGNLTSHTDVARPVLTDVDFYRDMSHLNDKYVIDGLGAGASDYYGNGYDVMTSAQVDEFGTSSDFRVYYEGEHDDFIDTDDNVNVNSANGTVVMSDGDSTRGYNWEDQVEGQTQYGPGQAPGFYIEVNSKKLAVTFDDTKGEWKVDTTSIQVAEGASGAITAINSSALTGAELAYAVADRFGIQLDPGKDHSGTNTEISGDIYLNATEEAITDLLGGGVQSESYNFDYYTKVDLQAVGGDVTVNVKLAESSGSFTLDFDDLDVAVESFHNVVGDDTTPVSGIVSSSEAGEFIKIDSSGDIAFGNGGDDTYVIGATPEVTGDATSGAIHGGVAVEYGKFAAGGGLENSESDAVNFNSVDSVDDLTFRRGKLRNEEEGSTLFIGDNKGNETVLFDNYNEYLDFRRVEYLTVEDGANDDEIYEIVTDDNLSAWDNEIYVADGGTMAVDLGGHDYIVGSSKADTFTFSLGDIVGSTDAKGTIDLLQLDSADKITFTDPNDIMTTGDEGTLNSILQAGVASGGGQVTFDFDYEYAAGNGTDHKLTVTYDSSNNDLDQTFDFII